MNFFKRTHSNAEERSMISQPSSGKNKELCSIGAIVNYSIAVDFVAVFLTCLIVIGCIGTAQHDLNSNFKHNRTNGRTLCFMFSNCEPPSNKNGSCDFLPEYSAHTCEGSIFGFSIIAFMALAFIISLVVKAILNHNLNWTLLIEVPTLVLFTLIVLALSIMISIGNYVTCESIKTYYKQPTCNVTVAFPNSNNKFYHMTRADIARNASWFVFMFVVVALVVYMVRLLIFIKRKRKQAIQQTLDREKFQEEREPKAI